MIISKKRIRKSSKYLSHVSNGETAYIGLPITEDVSTKLEQIGFSDLEPGESMVPSPKIGSISSFNANGKSVPQKDKPMITDYRQQYHEWEDWAGNSYSRIIDIPFPRYPREMVPAPLVRLTIVHANGNHLVILEPAIVKGETEEIDTVHRVNLMLEIFGRAEILKDNLDRYQVPKRIRLDWDILPEGEMPFSKFREHLEPVLKDKSNNKKTVITDRLETVSKYGPDFHAIGTNGYRGYIVFGFTDLNLYIFESAEYGNATYVFKGDWKELSQMTKSDIIKADLYEHRFVHTSGWHKQLEELFKVVEQ